MTPSPLCFALIKNFEGCWLKAYQDQNRIWTIGYGHAQGVNPGDTCTQNQADQWLMEDIQTASSCLQALVHGVLTQCELDALTSFIYNIGCERFKFSSLCAFLNFGNYEKAAAEFPKWCHAKGKISQGLLNRRNAEMNMFLGKTTSI